MEIKAILSGVIAPKVCELCGRRLVRGEELLCLGCLAEAPLYAGSTEELRMQRIRRGLPVARVYPWLAYRHDDPVCALIREGKYGSRPQLIEGLGRICAAGMLTRGAFDGLDCLVPVPMHWFKKMRRGYNQAELLALTLGRASGLRVVNALKAVHGHSSQTHMSAAGRLANIAGSIIPGRRAHIVEGLTVGLVDDIITTGATINECAAALASIPVRSITVITLAAAHD